MPCDYDESIIRQAIFLTRIEGLTVPEAARELGVSAGWLRPLLGRNPDRVMTAAQINARRARLAEIERNRDPIARLLGDPPPGRSALEQRGNDDG